MTAAAGGLALALCAATIAAILLGQSRDQKREQRPWVFADRPVFTSPITRMADGTWTASVTLTLHNTGHLPALYTRPIMEQIANPDGPDAIVKKQDLRCAKVPAGPETGETIFPGQSLARSYLLSGWQDWRAHDRLGGAWVRPYILGCIVYQTPDGGPHVTRFAYAVEQRLRPDDPLTRPMPVDPSSVPAQELVAVPVEWKDSLSAD